ncbi:YesL family protein [uncultured Enterococcus sp.]|uniref:YesL family protein n=1 Tax=uncultured Enterococcus sp. TaxID=167972 RepID=UPI002AA8C2C5|nr:YesL family protein [uncultured Enterococcus sp.]
MKLVETKIYTQLIVISDYLLLGLLWVIVSLPIVTLVPASAAVLYVLRQWQDGTTGSIFAHFFTGIRKHFFINLLASLLTVGIFAATNSLLQESSQVLIISGYVVSIIYLMFLLSWIDNCSRDEKLSVFKLFEQSALDLMVFFVGNLGCTLLIIFFTLLIFVFPPFIFLFAGSVWKLLYLILSRKRRVIE